MRTPWVLRIPNLYPTIWSGVRTNQQTNYQSHRSVYIADPSGAESNFTVLVYAITQ